LSKRRFADVPTRKLSDTLVFYSVHGDSISVLRFSRIRRLATEFPTFLMSEDPGYTSTYKLIVIGK